MADLGAKRPNRSQCALILQKHAKPEHLSSISDYLRFNIIRNLIPNIHLQGLEQRQYKNDSIQSKLIPTLKLPPFFTTYTVLYGEGKSAPFSKLDFFSDRMESFLFCLYSSNLALFMPKKKAST